ncbi:MAG: CRISPR-associated helicase Cas3' [Planctomycetes bacterium]|nr:CRISPR-associated helicase Cas3' [Planctomycetota bacterium]MCC7065158.1 CRISPR-associated helicase Cas3' [Planctomycetota bacterium]
MSNDTLPSRFSAWFAGLNGGKAPYAWQEQLALEPACRDRLLRIPTGFGKTAGTVLTWLWHRHVCGNPAWPRRLVFCLPMRVLVEQIEANIRSWLEALGVLWHPGKPHEGKVGLHVLMGGNTTAEWHLHPEHDAILVGTQDMLLSRALNRGYAAARARWPIEFGLLQQDCLWIFDEVQLMDVALATSAQMFAHRANDADRMLRPCVSWWMSATLQPAWLSSVDTEAAVRGLPQLRIAAEHRRGHLWDDVTKTCRVEPAADANAIANISTIAFREHGKGELTLIVCNTVDRACAVYAALARALRGDDAPDLRLVHSRFRPAERAGWRDAFLRRDAEIPATGRVIVATQVVEAGVDLDAHLLITELAPWPSLVQRFGRAARGGGAAEVIVLDLGFDEDKKSAPYAVAELIAAKEALANLPDVSPAKLEHFEDLGTADQLALLYPYEPLHLLLAHEWRELFDTTPDLTGGDLDISRFLRSDDERDVQVFWAPVTTDSPAVDLQPSREALCAVPFLAAQKWICDRGSRPKEGMRAWIWDWIDGRWTPPRMNQITPGRVILVASECGGYDAKRGFDPKSKSQVPPVGSEPASAQDLADNSQDHEPLSSAAWKTIAWHSLEVTQEVQRIAKCLGLPEQVARVLALAATWHDLGKAHPAFQGSIRHSERPARHDLAKAPADAWPRNHLYRTPDGSVRRGFRHELASALSLFAVLERHQPDHPGLLGDQARVLQALGMAPADRDRTAPAATPIETEILALTADEFDLLVFLVASHHGKVRMSLHATPADQDWQSADGLGMPIRGVREGDLMPATTVRSGDPQLPPTRLTLEPASMGLSPRTGRSWTERAQALVQRRGITTLGLLEALLRAADVRASRWVTEDPSIATVQGAS